MKCPIMMKKNTVNVMATIFGIIFLITIDSANAEWQGPIEVVLGNWGKAPGQYCTHSIILDSTSLPDAHDWIRRSAVQPAPPPLPASRIGLGTSKTCHNYGARPLF